MPTDDPSPPRWVFPSLPIVTPDPPRRSEAERFGALFYVGIGGLVVMVSLLGWFAWSVWSLRTVWTNVYVLHDPQRSDGERIEAAYLFSHDPAVNQRQLWDVALETKLPPLARYVVAESLTEEAAAADPRGYGLAVARSEGWPDWLRLLLVRPLAYRAATDLPLPREALAELRRSHDPATLLWSTYALAEGSKGDAEAVESLRGSAQGKTPEAPLAAFLFQAQEATRYSDRVQALDDATLWLRRHHPEASRLWNGWEVENDRLVPRRSTGSGTP